MSFIDLFKIVNKPHKAHILLFLPLPADLLFLPYRPRAFFSDVEGTVHFDARLGGVSAILCDHIGLGG